MVEKSLGSRYSILDLLLYDAYLFKVIFASRDLFKFAPSNLVFQCHLEKGLEEHMRMQCILMNKQK